MDVCRQCATTCSVGHAFSIVLIHRKLCIKFEKLSCCGEEESKEEWESVSAERGHWATLHNNLEVLIHLCNVVGMEALKKLPSVPFDDLPDHSKIDYVVDPSTLKLKFFDKGLII